VVKCGGLRPPSRLKLGLSRLVAVTVLGIVVLAAAVATAVLINLNWALENNH
jgi:hypothetical protein